MQFISRFVKSTSFSRSLLISGAIAVASLATQTHAGCEYKIGHQWDTGYLGEVVITNDTVAPLADWSVSWQYAFDSVNSIWGADANTGTRIEAQPFDYQGALAVGQSLTIGFVAAKPAGQAAEMPDLVGAICGVDLVESSGPIANGQCAANTGLGNGSSTKGMANVVLADGSAVQVKEGIATPLKFADGSLVSNALAVNNGDYAGSGACVALASGAIHCGPGELLSLTPFDVVPGVAYMTNGSSISGGFCALTREGEFHCHLEDDEALGDAVQPYSHASCGRRGCCVVDANDELHCTELDPEIQPAGKPLLVGGVDDGYCVVTDEEKSYCALTNDFQGVNAGGLLFMPQRNPVEPTPLSESVKSYAGGQFHSCWVTTAENVICSGGGNTANGAAGESTGPNIAVIKDATGQPLGNIIAINGGRGSACGVQSSGDLYCWGDAGGSEGVAVKIDLSGKKVRMPLECQTN